jgi:hypothetical protein
MGIVDAAKEALQRRRLEAEQTRLTRAAYENNERENTARIAAERETQRQLEIDRGKLGQAREKTPGPLERISDDATKQRLREAANAPPKPGPEPEKKPEPVKVATENELIHNPVKAQPSIGPGNFTSRTAVRQNLAAARREPELAIPERPRDRSAAQIQSLDRELGRPAAPPRETLAAKLQRTLPQDRIEKLDKELGRDHSKERSLMPDSKNGRTLGG